LDSRTLVRLREARERAVEKQLVAAQNPVLAWTNNLVDRSGSGSVVSRFLLPAAVLILGLLAINTWQQSQMVQEIEEIDAAVLTGDLPLDAYLDKGFDAWLKRSLH
jgi:hypothetical protein